MFLCYQFGGMARLNVKLTVKELISTQKLRFYLTHKNWLSDFIILRVLPVLLHALVNFTQLFAYYNSTTTLLNDSNRCGGIHLMSGSGRKILEGYSQVN